MKSPDEIPKPLSNDYDEQVRKFAADILVAIDKTANRDEWEWNTVAMGIPRDVTKGAVSAFLRDGWDACLQGAMLLIKRRRGIDLQAIAEQDLKMIGRMQPMQRSTLNNETVSVVTRSGEEFEVIAQVDSGSILTNDTDRPIGAGDRISRTLRNGAVETYMVASSEFTQKFGGLPEMYTLAVRKDGESGSRPRSGAVTYNVSVEGQNARANIGSVDVSTNIINDLPLFERLRAASQELPDDVAIAVVAQIESMERAKADEDTAALHKAGMKLVGLVAEYADTYGPYIPAVMKFIGLG